MEGGGAAESPLEVLSRAATMVQEDGYSSQHGNNGNVDEAKQQATKQLPTTKWKRDRRSRLPEYTRKSDPKIQESGFVPEPPSSVENKTEQSDVPIDMSVRQRGQPPSYVQTISNPGYRSGLRQTVITGGVTSQNGRCGYRNEIPSGMSMCDPIIDEHFRRSLGKDYLSVFASNNQDKPNVPVSSPANTEAVRDLLDNSGLSVDDHFAKALGDTWFKLKEEELKASNSTDGHRVVSI